MVVWSVPFAPIFASLYIAVLVVFVRLRDREPIKSREWLLAVFSSCFALSVTVISSLAEMGSDGYAVPCHVKLIPSYLFLPGVITVGQFFCVVLLCFALFVFSSAALM